MASDFQKEWEKARKAGKKTFVFSGDGKEKNTMKEGESKAQWESALKKNRGGKRIPAIDKKGYSIETRSERANELIRKRGVDESTALKVARVEKETGDKLRVTEGHRDPEEQQRLIDENLEISRKKYGFSKKVMKAIREGVEDRDKHGSSWDAQQYVKKQGGGKKAQEEVERLRYRVAAKGKSKHTLTRNTIDIQGSRKAIKKLKKEQGFSEHEEKDVEGNKTNFSHLETIQKPTSLGEIREMDRDIKSAPLKQKLQEAIKQPKQEPVQEEKPYGMSENLKSSLALISEFGKDAIEPALDLTKNTGKQIEEANKFASVGQQSDGAFMRPEEELEKKKNAAIKEMTPRVVERKIKEENPTPKVAQKEVEKAQEKVIRRIQNPEIPQKPSGGISDQFKEAMAFFAPTMIGALGGALIEGTEGAVAGAEAGTSLGESFRKFQLDKAKLEKSKSASPLELAKFKLSQDRLEQSKAELEEQRKRTTNLEEDRKLRREIKDIEMVKSDKTAFKQQAEVKEYLRNLNELQNLEDIVVHGKKIPGASLSLIARSISKEVGTLNEGDVSRAQVDPSLISSAKRNIVRWTRGEILPSDVKEIQAMVEVLKKKRKRKTISYAKGFVDSRAKHIRDPELRKAFFEDILAENDLGTVEEAEGLLQTNAPVKRTIMTEEQKRRLQELRAKHRK